MTPARAFDLTSPPAEAVFPVPSRRDVFVVPGFMQGYLGEDPDAVMREFAALPVQRVDEPIARDPADVRIIGAHPALRYRGHPINRHKVWAQTDYDGGLRAYRHTGWTWAIADATKPVENVPFLDRIRTKMAAFVPDHNHWIATMYKDGDDTIGLHGDKDKDFVPGTWIVVLKLGPAARRFQFAHGDDVFFAEPLEPGTAVFMTTEANKVLKHGVPPDPGAGLSGSIVSRAIATVFPWDEVTQKQAAARRTAERAREHKERRREEQGGDD